MKLLRVKRVYVLACVGLLGFSSLVNAAPRLMGGVATEEGSWPAVAALFESESTPAAGYLTSAVLVHPRFLLTAAHTVAGLRPDELSVLMGTTLLSDETAEPLAVVDIIVHPEFIDERLRNYADLALIRLATPVADVAPVALAEGLPPSEQLGAETITVGWAGNTSSLRRLDFQQQLTLPIASLELGNARASYNGMLDETMVPVGTDTMTEDGCLETESAPIFIETNGQLQVLGVTSFGQGCRKRLKYNIATNIHHYRPWILSTLWPDYAAWESERETNGFAADHDSNGVSNLEQYATNGSLQPLALAEAWANATTATVEFQGGLRDRELVIESSEDLLDWKALGPDDISVSESADTTTWTLSSPETSKGQRYLRLKTSLSSRYTPTPKPAPFGANLAGEFLSSEDSGEREYLITQAEDVDQVRVRVGSEAFPASLTLIDALTGDILGTKDPEAGSPTSLVVDGGRDLIARLSTNGAEEMGNYDFLVTTPPVGIVAPTSLVYQLQTEDSDTPLNLRVTNRGDGVLDYVVSTTTPWLSIAETNGSIESKKFANIAVTALPSTLVTAGVHEGSVRVQFVDGETHDIAVTATLRPSGTVLSLGRQIVGSLSSTDEVSDFVDPFSGVSLPMDRYVFEAPSDGFYLISMGSGVIDSYLYLYDVNGFYITEADDSGFGSIFNAGIRRNFTQGEIVIVEATCFGVWDRFGAYGPYQINAVRLGPIIE